MSNELSYRIKFNADLSGAHAATKALDELQGRTGTIRGGLREAGRASGEASSALDTLASRSGYAQQAFMGMEMAAHGNITAVFGVARAVRALMASLTAAGGAFTIIVAILLAAAKAYTYFKERAIKAMEDATKAMTAYNEKMRPLVDRLKELRDKSKEVTFSIKEQQDQIRLITDYYDSASESAKRYAEMQKKVVASGAEMEKANVGLRKAWGMLGAKTPGEKAKVELKAEFDDAEIDYTAKKALLDIEKAMTEKEIKISAKRLFALEDILAPAPAIAQAQEQLAGLEDQLGKITSIPRGEMTAQQFKQELKLTEAIASQQKGLEDLEKAEQERISSVKTGISKEKEKYAQLQSEQNLQTQLGEIIEQHNDALKTKLAYQERLNAEQAKMVALTEAERTAQEAITMSQSEESGTLANLKEDAAELTRQYEHQYKMAVDPAYRKAQDKLVKDQEKEEKHWQNQVRRAQEAEKRGARGRWITETLRAAETGRGMLTAKQAVEKAEANMAVNIERSATYLEEIRDNIKTAAGLG